VRARSAAPDSASPFFFSRLTARHLSPCLARERGRIVCPDPHPLGSLTRLAMSGTMEGAPAAWARTARRGAAGRGVNVAGLAGSVERAAAIVRVRCGGRLGGVAGGEALEGGARVGAGARGVRAGEGRRVCEGGGGGGERTTGKSFFDTTSPVTLLSRPLHRVQRLRHMLVNAKLAVEDLHDLALFHDHCLTPGQQAQEIGLDLEGLAHKVAGVRQEVEWQIMGGREGGVRFGRVPGDADHGCARVL